MKKTTIGLGLIGAVSLTVLGGFTAFAFDSTHAIQVPPPAKYSQVSKSNSEAVEAYRTLLDSKSEAILAAAAEMGIATADLELQAIVKAIGDKDRSKIHELGLTPPPKEEKRSPKASHQERNAPPRTQPSAPATSTESTPVTTNSNNSENAGYSVNISGGFNTDPQDRGRPVVLIAAALGVPTEVFREAFSGVTPAGLGSGGPSSEQAHQNKAALLKVLGPYGITNERLDEVSNYYRYNGSKGETWSSSQASARVIVTDGVVTGVSITNPGSGYSSDPVVTITGPNGKVTATASIAYTKDFKTNGSISAITIQ